MTGPVQVLVLGFEEPELSGAAMAELERLGDAGVARLLDVLLVTRTGDGGIETLPAPPGARPDAGRLVTALLAEAEDESAAGSGAGDSDPTAWSLDQALPPTGAVAIALIEHAWAEPLVRAIRGAGGRLLDETWLASDDRALLETLSGAE